MSSESVSSSHILLKQLNELQRTLRLSMLFYRRLWHEHAALKQGRPLTFRVSWERLKRLVDDPNTRRFDRQVQILEGSCTCDDQKTTRRWADFSLPVEPNPPSSSP